MKRNYILLGILFNICFFSRSFSQITDTEPPNILAGFSDIYFLSDEVQVTEFPGDSILLSMSCYYSFPYDYLQIFTPTITDDIDPTPKVDTITTIDTVSKRIVRNWIATDASGNISQYKEIVFYAGVEYQLNLNSIEINNRITILDIDPLDIFNVYKKDSIYFCNDSILNFTIDSDWKCNKYKKEFNWKVNGKLAYSKEDYQYSLSLDTLPAAFEVIVQANKINNNFDNEIKFTILHLPKAKTEIVYPSCNGSKDGSIQILNTSSIKWDDNSVNPLREGLAVGQYQFTYFDDSCSRTETVELFPGKKLEFSIPPDVIDLSLKNYITITNTSSLEGPYIWQIGDSVFVNNNNEFKYFLRKAGQDTITLSVGGACTDRFIKTFTVTGQLPTGLQQENTGKIEISPTLVRDRFQLNLPGNGTYSARIFDLQGVEVYHFTGIDAGKSIIAVEKLSAGSYIIQVFKEAKMVYNQKFIKVN